MFTSDTDVLITCNACNCRFIVTAEECETWDEHCRECGSWDVNRNG